MWVLVFVYFYDTMPYVETITAHDTMTECFQAREEVGKGSGYFKAGQQALCIGMADLEL